MGLISPHSPTPTASDCTRSSASFRTLPVIAVTSVFSGGVPFWAIFTPDTALILINNSTEKLGVL
jgi:hypothetical protein